MQSKTNPSQRSIVQILGTDTRIQISTTTEQQRVVKEINEQNAYSSPVKQGQSLYDTLQSSNKRQRTDNNPEVKSESESKKITEDLGKVIELFFQLKGEFEPETSKNSLERAFDMTDLLKQDTPDFKYYRNFDNW